MDLEIQNQALELSRAILQDLPIPVIGISREMTVVLSNSKAETMSFDNGKVEVGQRLADFFSSEVQDKIADVLTSDTGHTVKGYRCLKAGYDLELIPLSGRFRGQGVVMTLTPVISECQGVLEPAR